MTREPEGGDGFLTGKLLVATPTLGDPNFAHAVVYLCTHSDEGAMGLMVNRPVNSPDLGEVLRHFDIRTDGDRGAQPVYFGGPVEQGKGFVLHTDDYRHEFSMPVLDAFVLTSSIDILRDIAGGRGPRRSLVALGYAGWAPGQLDQELRDNSWLSVDASETRFSDPTTTPSGSGRSPRLTGPGAEPSTPPASRRRRAPPERGYAARRLRPPAASASPSPSGSATTGRGSPASSA